MITLVTTKDMYDNAIRKDKSMILILNKDKFDPYSLIGKQIKLVNSFSECKLMYVSRVEIIHEHNYSPHYDKMVTGGNYTTISNVVKKNQLKKDFRIKSKCIEIIHLSKEKVLVT